MRDKDIGEAEVFFEAIEEVQNLRLHRDIESRHRLVADDKFRMHCQRSRNTNPLSLTTREFMRITLIMFGLQSHLGEQFANFVATFFRVRFESMDQHRLRYRVADAHLRVQRRIRILKHYLRMFAIFTQVVAAQRHNILAFKDNLAFGRFHQT